MSHFPVADAHQHFWDLSRSDHPWLCEEPPVPFRYGEYRALRRSYLPPEYRADSSGHNVVKTVHVEAEWNPRDPVGETRWLHDLAGRHGVPNAIVAQAWLHHPDAADVLAAQAEFPLVRSVRQKPAAASSPGEVVPGAPCSMGDPSWRAGYALLERHGLSFDLQTPWWHLGEAAELARAFPATRIVLNHTGLPAHRSDEGLAGWREGMERLAGEPNTAVKISGLGVPGQPWTVEGNRQIVLDAIAIFGVKRAMFASNFPVDSLVASFDTIFAGFKEIVSHLPQPQKEQLFYGNAVRIYRIDE